MRVASAPTVVALTHLLDMTPQTSSFADSALAVGKTFYDPDSSTAIKLDSLGPLGATRERRRRGASGVGAGTVLGTPATGQPTVAPPVTPTTDPARRPV